MLFACHRWIAVFALVSAPHPHFPSTFITIRIFRVAGMVHISGDRNLPICYQCLELKNTCLDFHQSENLCLITPFPSPFWWKSSKCEMKGSNGLSECFSQPCWKWLRHWLSSISSEKAIPKVGVNLQLSNGLIHIILYASLNYTLPAVILEVWNRFLPKILNRNGFESCGHESG